MSVMGDRRPRQVVPRWRPWRVTARLGLAEPGAKTTGPRTPPTVALERRRREWLENHDVPHAADVVGTAFGMGLGERARDAAEFILGVRTGVPRPLELLALKIVDGDSSPLGSPLDVDRFGRYRRVQRLKRRLRDWPHDALARIDLAREYTILGQRSKACGPIRTALLLAPTSSFVVRSAARFFLNYGDPERALSVVHSAPGLRRDPWLLAAELAVAGAAGRTSRFTKAARSMIRHGDFAPKHISELAGAFATMELKSGKRRSARKFFSTALEVPTENTLAQAEWACRELPELDAEIVSRVSDRSYEARARVSLGRGEWSTIVNSAKLWRLDEPFATRAAHFGSFAALTVVEDIPQALEFANFGLSTKPRDLLLLNNKAVALALVGRATEAAQTLGRIETLQSADDVPRAVHLATTGLVQFRLGHPDTGRQLYQRAVEIAKRSRNLLEETLALLFQAREEARWDLQKAQKLLAAAEAAIPGLNRRDEIITQRMLTIVSRAHSEGETGIVTGE